MNHAFRLAGSLAIFAVAAAAQFVAPGKPKLPPGTYYLPASSSTVVVGNYWSENAPALRVHAGDTVLVDTVTVFSPTSETRNGVPDADVEPDLKEIFANFPKDKKGPGTHVLTGPIFIDGAEPGDTLVVHIEKIEGRSHYALNSVSRAGFLAPVFPDARQTKLIRLDWKTDLANFGPGINVPMHPFFGSIGVAPTPAIGRHSSVPPDQIAGNMDNKDLIAGTTLFIPVWVPGALLEIGDGHAGQGDGEISGNAMETSLRATLRFEVLKNTGLTYPRAETPTLYIAMGFDPDLTKAALMAGEQMVDFLVNTKGMTKPDAYQLCSVAADFHIAELVDQNVGVQVQIKKSLFTGAPATKP